MQEYADRLKRERDALAEELLDLVDQISRGRRGQLGDHHIYSPQISEARVERARTALAARRDDPA